MSVASQAQEVALIVQVKLTTLDVGNNEIEEIENISHLTALEEFWVSHCVFNSSEIWLIS
jgi:hypothetical protein